MGDYLLYWNGRRFVEGKRRRTSPYQLLGLALRTGDGWQLLGMDPDLVAPFIAAGYVAGLVPPLRVTGESAPRPGRSGSRRASPTPQRTRGRVDRALAA